MKFPISELCNIKSWHKMMFNNLINHILDSNIKSILNNNYETFYKSMQNINIEDMIKNNITNNAFFVVGVVENNLNTLTKYEE